MGPAARLLVCAGLAAGCVACAGPRPEAPRRVARADILLQRETEVIQARVPRNATLASLLLANEISSDLAQKIVDATARAFDPRRLKADQPYRLERTVDGLVREFVYKIDANRFLRIAGLDTAAEARGFDVQVVPYEKQLGTVSITGEITRERSSLVSAVNARGESILLAMAIADVFGGDIDFNNDLQPGDHFEVVFERQVTDGELAGYGPILAATFYNDGRTLRAYRYQTPGGEPGYYDEQGRSLKRFFLRSPLKFEPRISSGFSFRRLHPVLGTWRSHPAIDYVAPVGAPVIAVAGGTVVKAGWSGDAGNMVTIRHTNGYESSYLHLSAITKGVVAGAHVSQGTDIGRVGATGLATGPHLDYRLKRNGEWVNPLVEHKKLPPGEPIPASLAADFDAARAAVEALFIRVATLPTNAN